MTQTTSIKLDQFLQTFSFVNPYFQSTLQSRNYSTDAANHHIFPLTVRQQQQLSQASYYSTKEC